MAETYYKAVVMGGSAGGFDAMTEILAPLPKDFQLPILVVQHMHPRDEGAFAKHLARATGLHVIEPFDKEAIHAGCVYTAPANYHMLVEKNGTIALSVDEKVRWSRPSIDVLFESAAHTWFERLIAVILSGANHDGTHGMQTIKALGGLTVAQSPASAEQAIMPQAAIEAVEMDYIMPPEDIAALFTRLGKRPEEK